MLSPADSGLGLQLRTEIPELSRVWGRDPLRARLSIVSPKALALLSPCGISDWHLAGPSPVSPHTSEPRAQNSWLHPGASDSGHLGGAEGVLFFSLFFFLTSCLFFLIFLSNYLILLFLLKYSCFTTLYSFLLYNVNQL